MTSPWLGPRIALRELRTGLRGFGVFLACLALGVGAVTAVATLSACLDQGIRRDARMILGGDVEVRLTHRPLPAEALEFLEKQGRVARVVRTRTMARRVPDPERSGDPAEGFGLAELKGVGPGYPLYGELKLASGMDIQTALAGRDGLAGAVADPRLLEKLGASLGDEVEAGGVRFLLMDEILREPDRAGSFFSLGPRLMVPLSSLEETGLLAPGSLSRFGYRVRLAEGGALTANGLKAALRDRFDDASGWRIRSFDQAAAGLDRFLDNISFYLLLVGLAALLVGGIGVANGVKGYLSSKTQAMAAMKCVGATRSQIFSAYLCQILVLSLAGIAIGVGLALPGANLLAIFLAERFGLSVAPGVYPGPVAAGLAYGLLTALAFSLWPLSSATRVSPARLFSGYVDPAPRRAGPLAMAGVLTCAGLMAWLTLVQSGSPRITWGFLASVAGGSLVFAALSWGIKLLAARAPSFRTPRLRHAVANLARPGSPVTAVVFSLGLGLTALNTVAMVESSYMAELSGNIPESAPSYFFLGITKEGMDDFRETLLGIQGVERLAAGPSLRGRIEAVDGVPADEMEVDPEVSWALRGDRSMSFSAEIPEGATITRGEWWPPGYDGPPLISFDQRIAEGFGVDVGDTLTLNIMGRSVTGTIASLRRIDWTTAGLNHVILFSPGVLEAAPYSWIATAYATPEAEPEIRARVAESFPAVASIYVKDVLSDVTSIVENIAMAVRAATLLILAAGLLILAETVRAGLRTRHAEAVIFKVCGATRWDVMATFGLEFLLLGLASGVVALLLGGVLARGFIAWVIHIEWTLSPLPPVAITLGGVAVTVGLGLLGVRKVLGLAAWPVLRNE